MLASKFFITAVTLTLMHMVIPSSQAAIEVTNEHLRDGLLSLVHSYSLLENKLDRHEQRERALGDVIKRGLQTLQKGQKIFEPIRGTFSRLDERMSQIEGVLMAQDEKFNEHQTEIRNSLEAIKKLVASDGSKATVEKPADGSVGQLSKQVEDLSVNVKELRREIGELLKKPADTTSKGLLEQTEKMINSKLSSADDVIARIEEKLTHFYVTAPVNPPSNDRNVEWENNVSKSLQEIKTNVNAMKSNDITSSNSRDGSDSPALDKDFFVTLANQTLEAIEDMRLEVLTASDKSFTKTASRIKESADKLDGSINEVLKTIESTSSDGNQDGVRSSISELKKEFNALAKLEQMLAQMGDNVLSVKRGMEFNVHAVSLEVGEVVKANTRELNETINSRFDAINNTISRNHNGALANLTSKIETEISQVWRQIGIMYQEVSSSKDAVNKLQERTETYVNGTLTTMDSMEGKVSLITGRMTEVDSNLNYLLGRLSLVTQEFNKIKNGLGTALDNIRSSFQIVQTKIQDSGPGPHKIDSEENIQGPEFSLLPQRDAPATP